MDKLQVFKAFGARLKKNARLNALWGTVKTYAQAQEYAKVIGSELATVLSEVADLTNLSVEEVTTILAPCFKTSYGNILEICRQAQQGTLDRAGLGIGVLDPAPYTADQIAKAATDITQLTAPEVKGLTNIINQSTLGVVDDSIRVNAKAAENMGLRCKITRTYDGVGLRMRTQACKWCMSRAGSWDNYSDAYSAGAFERHPGCGCLIDYEYGKTRQWSRSAGEWVDK